MALLFGMPALAGAETEAKAKSQGINKPVGPAKQTIVGTEKHDKIAHREEKALQKLLQVLEELEQHRHHHRHHQGQGSFAAGLQQAGDSTITNDGSTSTSDSAGDSLDGGTSSGGTGGSTGVTMSAGAATGPGSTASSSQPTGSKSQNKSSQRLQARRGNHSLFAQGLIHTEREWREYRRERRLERAFARGMAALREAEQQHSTQSAANSRGTKNGTATDGSKTASVPTVTTSAKAGATSSKSGEPKWGADEQKHWQGDAGARKSGTIHLAEAGKGHEHMRSHTGGLVGKNPGMVKPRNVTPSGGTGHTNPTQHAGALAGTKTSGHKK